MPGTTVARGYGADHQAERARWEPIVSAGKVMCAKQLPQCTGQPLQPGQPWDLDHNATRTGWNGPACIPCNRGEGGTNGAGVLSARRLMVIREWDD